MANTKGGARTEGYTAVVLGDYSPITARLVWAWLGRGHRIDSFWTCVEPKMAALRIDRQLAYVRPGWSVSAALKRHAVPVVEITRERLTEDQALGRRVAEADLLISCMFALRVPAGLLAAAGGRALNLHPALLPAWRGSAPLHSMVQAGRGAVDGGLTLHAMVERFDAGAIIASIAVPLAPGQTWIEWRLALARAAGAMVDRGIVPFMTGDIAPRPQGKSPTPYSRKADRHFVIDRGTQWEKADRLMTLLGRSQSVDLDTGRRLCRVVGGIRKLGPPTGQAARAGPFAVSMDLVDARCRFRRRLPGASRRFRLRQLWSLIKAPY